VSPERPRVLVIAYACEPDRGSEPGAGWGLVKAASTFARCTVVVGPEHAAALERWLSEHPEATPEALVVAEPRWAQLATGGRFRRFLLYLAWLRRARRACADAVRRRDFDIVWHATYSTYWLPSPAVDLGLPSVWGPVGGAATTPLPLWRYLGIAGLLSEVLDYMGVRLFGALTGARRTARRATVCVAQNEETRLRLPEEARAKARVLNHALFVHGVVHAEEDRGEHLVWVGALESRKGPRLALTALAQTPTDVRLVLAGDGRERRSLQRLVRKLGVVERVEFRGAIPRPQLMQLVGSSAGAVFTGLREEGGLALAEAMYAGVPVVVLDNGGAGTIAHRATDPDRVLVVHAGSARDTVRSLAAAMTRLVRDPVDRTQPLLDSAVAVAELKAVFDAANAAET
jgi:glycosyltransferase involved in cell wall biosynthesis